MSEPADAGSEAMRLLDKIVAEKPEKNGHDLSAAIRCLVTMRDALATEHGPSERLDSVNAVISSVLGVQYPMHAIPWPSVDAARKRLAGIMGELESGA